MAKKKPSALLPFLAFVALQLVAWTYIGTNLLGTKLGPSVVGSSGTDHYAVTYDHPTRSYKLAAGSGGVTGVNAGTGISVTGPTNSPTITNTGVLSVTAGTNVTLGGTAANPIINASGGGGSMTGKINGTGATTIDTVNVTGTLLGTKSSISGTTINVSLDKIVNADVAAAAAIAYSKLLLTGGIVNADINAAAAIVYSKLALTASIVNADVAAGAAIAYSKLALTTSIVNGDISASAAIAYGKLSLTGSILNADVNASAAIAYSKLALSNSIVNADINSAAAIAYSKLNLTNSVLLADIASAAKTGTGTKLVTDASPTITTPDLKGFVLWDAGATQGTTFTGIGNGQFQLGGSANKVTISVAAANSFKLENGILLTSNVTPDTGTSWNAYAPTFIWGSDAQYDIPMRGASIYSALHKGSNSTVLQISSGGVLQYGTVTSAMITDGTITDTDVASANKDGATGTASMRTLGTASTQAFPGNGAIDTLGAATDITTLNGTTSAHGLMPKGSNSAFTFYNSQMGQTLPGGKMRIHLSPQSCLITGAAADPLPLMIAGANITYPVLRYLDAVTTDGRFFIGGAVTKDYAGGNITVHIWYKGTDTTNTRNTFWAISMLSRGDDDVLDTAYSTARTFTRLCKSTASHVNDATSGSFTPNAGELTAGKICLFQVERQGSSGTDTDTGTDDVEAITMGED